MKYYREFNDIDSYKKELLGRKIIGVSFLTACDEGLAVLLDNQTILCFGFSGCEGTIKIIKPAPGSVVPTMKIDLGELLP